MDDLQQAHARQPRLESIGGGHHVPVRFRVVRDGLDAEHAAHFVHHVALLAVHHREGEGARLLVFAFLGQLNQLAQPVVDHLDQGGVLFGVRPQELGVVGLQLGRQVRVADLQSDGEPAVALQRAALVVAFQGLVTLRLSRAQDVAQLDGSTALHFLHRRGQLGGRDAAVLLAKVVTRAHLLPVATLARHLDHLPAGQIRRALALVARRLALVGAGRARFGATLATHFRLGGVRLASVFVARFDARVAATRKLFGAGESTAEGALVAGDGFALFVFAVAVLGGEDDTGRAVGFGVTVVEDWVGAGVLAGAGFVAGRFARSARHRREDDGCTALAG